MRLRIARKLAKKSVVIFRKGNKNGAEALFNLSKRIHQKR